MMRGVILGGLVVFVAGSSQAAEIVRLDFEQSDTVADFPQVLTTRGEAAIVAAGGDRAGHCLRLANAKPATACGMRLTGIRLERNLVLVLDYRAHVEPGCEGAYLGVAAEIGGTQVLWTSAPFSSQWRTAAIPLAGLMAKANAADVAPGTELSAIRIYARVKEKTAVKGETKARMELWIDNLRVKTERYLAGPMAERESYANPPLLIWARGQGPTRLEYSRDPDFAAGVTKSVEVAGNFHTPPAAWEPGVWYWRASRCARLADHWVASGSRCRPRPTASRPPPFRSKT